MVWGVLPRGKMARGIRIVGKVGWTLVIVLAIIAFVMRGPDTWAASVSTWPSLSFSQWLGLLLSVVGVGLHGLIVSRAKRWGDSLLREACKELQQELRARLDQLALWGPLAVRALANDIQDKMQAPYITDAMLTAVTRRVQFAESRATHGHPPPAGFTFLNNVLIVFDPKRIQLMSIAAHDRMLAYTLGVGTLSLAGLFIQWWLTSFAAQALLPLLLFWAMPLGQAWLIFCALRARKFWHTRLLLVRQGLLPDPGTKPCLRPWIDCFVALTHAQGPHVHTQWAPLWEELLFGTIPMFTLPYAITWATFQSIQGAVSDDVLRAVLTYAAVLVVVIVGIFKVRFVNFHRLSYYAFRNLKKRLDEVNRNIEVVRIDRRTPIPLASPLHEDALLRRKVAICRKLWTLDGDDSYVEAIRDASLNLWHITDNAIYRRWATIAQSLLN